MSEYGEPKPLHQAEPGTKSPAQLISTSDADEPPQKCVKARSRLQPDKPSEDLPLWASGIRRLSFCFRSAPLHYIRTPILFTSIISLPSARIYKGKAVWRLSPFSSGKSCELRDFAYGENLYVLMQDFPPPKVKRLQLVNAPDPTGENDRQRAGSASLEP